VVRYLFYTIGDITYQSPLVLGKRMPRPTRVPPLCQALCQLQRRHSKRSDSIMRPCCGSGR